MKNLIQLSSALSTALVLTASAQSEVLYVSANLASGANNGDSWSNAFQGSQGLQAALAAAVPGDQIYVAHGLYKPTATLDRTISFEWKAGIQIYGGFLGTESNPYERPQKGAAPTILSGDLDSNDTPTPAGMNSYHVVEAIGTDSDSLLDRLIIEGGLADSASITPNRGGGLFSDQATALRLQDCLFRSNRAAGPVGMDFTGDGGAAYLSASSIEVVDCDFIHNFAMRGGAVFVDNVAIGRVLRNRIDRNESGLSGGGLYALQSGSLEIKHSQFVRNSVFDTSGDVGGAIFLDGVIAPRVINCTIARNTESIALGFGNGYGIHSSGSATEITNCIVWRNGPFSAPQATSQISGAIWNHSLVEWGPTTDGNLNAAPQFVNDWVDFALTATSPGVDAGNNLAVEATAYSVDHGRRFSDSQHVQDTGQGDGAIVDMGAYEYTPFRARYDCAGVANSTGHPALIYAGGSTDVAQNQFSLGAGNLPLNQFGYFLASRTPGLTQLPGNSNGNLCLGGSIRRLNRIFEIGNTANLGYISVGINVASIPQPQGPFPILAGETWYFQAWFRDNAAGLGSSNFTDRVGVDFE